MKNDNKKENPNMEGILDDEELDQVVGGVSFGGSDDNIPDHGRGLTRPNGGGGGFGSR